MERILKECYSQFDATEERTDILSPSSIRDTLIGAYMLNYPPSREEQQAVQAWRQQFGSSKRVDGHVCDDKCIYQCVLRVFFPNEVDDLVRIIIDSNTIQPSDVFVPQYMYCCSFGPMHYCGSNCTSIVPRGGSYVCWKTNIDKGIIVVSVDPSNISSANTFTAADGTQQVACDPMTIEESIGNTIAACQMGSGAMSSSIIPSSERKVTKRRQRKQQMTPSHRQLDKKVIDLINAAEITSVSATPTPPPRPSTSPFASLSSSAQLSLRGEETEEVIDCGFVAPLPSTFHVSAHTTQQLSQEQSLAQSLRASHSARSNLSNTSVLVKQEWCDKVATVFECKAIDPITLHLDTLAVASEVIAFSDSAMGTPGGHQSMSRHLPCIVKGHILMKMTMDADKKKNVLIAKLVRQMASSLYFQKAAASAPPKCLSCPVVDHLMSPAPQSTPQPTPSCSPSIIHSVETLSLNAVHEPPKSLVPAPLQCVIGISRIHIAGFSIPVRLENTGLDPRIVSTFKSAMTAAGCMEEFMHIKANFLNANAALGALLDSEFGGNAHTMSRGSNTTQSVTVVQSRFIAITNWAVVNLVHSVLVENIAPKVALDAYRTAISLCKLD